MIDSTGTHFTVTVCIRPIFKFAESLYWIFADKDK